MRKARLCKEPHAQPNFGMIMLIWSNTFETKLELVDLQHKNLFNLLNKLVNNLEMSGIRNEELEKAIKLLIHYTKTSFNDEELLMMESHVDKRHLTMHRMEHQSFLYDVDIMNDITSFEDRRITGKVIKLVRFITLWLTFHILRTDMVMAAQISHINLGMSPQQAYEKVNSHKIESANVYKMLDAIIDLWSDAKERCNQLEKTSREMKKKIAALERELQIASINSINLIDPMNSFK